MKRIIITLLTILLSTLVHAIPTIQGPSGLITVPTAESLKYKEFNFAIDSILNEDDKSQSLYYKVNLGTFQNWELGFVGGKTPTEGVFINAKYYLLSDNSRFPLSIAIGLQNLASKSLTDVYMVVSKRFKGGFIGHFGFNANFANKDVDPSIMGGLEYLLNEYISIIGDIDGKRQTYVANAGIALYLTESFVIRGAVLDVGNNNDTRDISVGLSYTQFL